MDENGILNGIIAHKLSESVLASQIDSLRSQEQKMEGICQRFAEVGLLGLWRAVY